MNVQVVYTSIQVITSAGLVGLVVKASTSRTEDPEFDSRLRREDFPGRIISVT